MVSKPWRWRLILLVVALVSVAKTHHCVSDQPLTGNDLPTILANLRDATSADRLGWLTGNWVEQNGYYRPLVSFSFDLDYHLFGPDQPAGWRGHNVLILMVFSLLVATLAKEVGGELAGLAAGVLSAGGEPAWFVVRDVAPRTDALCGVFCLVAALGAWRWGTRVAPVPDSGLPPALRGAERAASPAPGSPEGASGRPPAVPPSKGGQAGFRSDAALTLTGLVLALACKELALSLVLLLPLFAWCAGAPARRVVKGWLAVFGVAVVYWLLRQTGLQQPLLGPQVGVHPYSLRSQLEPLGVLLFPPLRDRWFWEGLSAPQWWLAKTWGKLLLVCWEVAAVLLLLRHEPRRLLAAEGWKVLCYLPALPYRLLYPHYYLVPQVGAALLSGWAIGAARDAWRRQQARDGAG